MFEPDEWAVEQRLAEVRAEQQERIFLKFCKQGVWTTRDKRRIRFSDMADSHLANTIAYCKRNPNSFVAGAVPYLEQEQERRKANTVPCFECGGWGMVPVYGGGPNVDDHETCFACKGSGRGQNNDGKGGDA